MKTLDTNTQNAINKVVEKKTRTEKYSLAYILDMSHLNKNLSYTVFINTYKRSELVEIFNTTFNTNII